MSKKLSFALLLIVICFPAAAHSETLRWRCAYSSVATPKGLSVDKFALEFALDTVTGKAVIIGNAGLSDVDASSGGQGITFQEKLSSGAIQTTTISKNGSSVHSRHTMINGDLVASQYYGICK